MIPHEKKMVERLKDKTFALLGINSDGGRDALRKIVKEQGISLRHFGDGTTEGPIAKRWNVHGWPTIFILDQKGVIRYKDLRDEALEKAVVKLIEEAEATR